MEDDFWWWKSVIFQKKYGAYDAVNDVSFKADKGDVLGILGKCDAGKTTLMNMLTGCLIPTCGTVTADGYDIFKSPAKAKRLIGYMPESAPLYLDMTVKEHLLFVCRLRHVPRTHIKSEIESAMEKNEDRRFKPAPGRQSLERLQKNGCFGMCALRESGDFNIG